MDSSSTEVGTTLSLKGITNQLKRETGELMKQFKISDDNYGEVAKNIKTLLNKNGELRKLLDSIVSPA